MPDKLFLPTHPSSPFSHAYTRTHHQPDSSPPELAQWVFYIKASAYGSRVGWTPARYIHTYTLSDKRYHHIFSSNFVKCWPIFIILSSTNLAVIFNTNISQDSVVMHLRRGGMFNCFFTRNLLLSLSLKDLKVGYYLVELEAKIEWHLFSGHGA